MESNLNKLLIRQIKRHFGSVENIPEGLKGILNDINNTYENFEDDIHLLQNSIEISSQELRSAFQKHKQDAEAQKKTINKINEAIQVMNPALPQNDAVTESTRFDSNYMFDSLIRLIEERKRTEEEILKLSLAVEQNPASIVITDIDGNIEYVNAKFCDLTGYTKEESIGKNPRILKAEDADPEFYKNLWTTISSGNEWKGEFHNKKKNGELYWELASISAVKNSNGGIINFLAIKEDITERKLVTEALKESEKKYREVVQNVKEVIFQTDTAGLWVFLNQAWEEITGFSVEESLGQLFSNYVHPDDRQYNMELFEPLIMHKKDYCRHQIRYLTKDGGFRWIEVFARLGLNEKDEVIGTYGTLQDITERKLAEEELMRVSTRLTLATFAGGVGVWELDINKSHLWWDDQMFVLYRVKKEDFCNVYEAWLERLHPDDLKRTGEEIQMAIRGEKDFDTEFMVCWPDGSVHNIRALATVQTDSAGNPLRMIGTNWDITGQKKNEAILLKARQEAEMANNAKSIFLANMSHEIRTPLNAIIGFSQLINREPYLTKTQKDYTNSIISAGEHLLSLINDILELSKMEAGRLELYPQNIDLYSLFGDIRMLFMEPAKSKHLQFIFELSPDIPRYVIVDDNKLRRIFINLIGNAIKFTNEGGIAVRARVDKINIHKSRLIVEVQDSGPGIAATELHKLFKHFVQTSTGINNNNGTGLGLALSRELAILMGGDISVNSEVGKGSVFTFYVDIQVGKAEYVQNLIKRRVVGFEKTNEDYRILVVDDTEENLQVVVSFLNLVGFITREALNGEDAIAIFEEWDPHLILMDMRMPKMDGYEATRRIKSTSKGKQTPIIALTASSFEDERKKIGNLGIQGHIRKPFRESELFGTVGNILGIKYIFEDEVDGDIENYQFSDAELIENIAGLPAQTIRKMKEAVDVADIDLLIELIVEIESVNSILAQHLFVLANNYDYEYLQRILN
jgi:PAS domain S-box-containing protein